MPHHINGHDPYAYAGLDNELFYMDKTMMVFGDAKTVVEDMTKAIEWRSVTASHYPPLPASGAKGVTPSTTRL